MPRPPATPPPFVLTSALLVAVALGAAPRRAAAEGRDGHATSAASIIERNPFDSVRGSLVPPAWPAEAPAVEDPYRLPVCEGVKVTSIAVDPDQTKAFGLLSAPGTASVRRRQGDAFAGKRVWYVTRDRVWLYGPGVFCQARLFPREGDGAAKRQGGDISRPPESHVRRLSATEFEVDRSEVDELLETQAKLGRSPFVPEIENGRVVGLRAFGVRPDRLAGELGVENGDRFEKVNGRELTQESILETYAHARTSDTLTLSLTRRGQAMTITYRIK